MWFRALFQSLKHRPLETGGRQALRRLTSRLRVESLEDRAVPALIADPVGDFLPTYTGVQDPGLDVVAHEVVYLEDQGELVFFGQMTGPVAPTAAVGGLYLFGVDRGQGTPRFRGRVPEIGPNVVWDSIGGVITPLDPSSITITGNEFTVRVPLSLMSPLATRPPEEWTYNLWPRNGVSVGMTVQVSDLAPDDGNSPVQTIAPARVESIIVNDGAAQRSMVNSVTVTFDGEMTLDAGAIELSRQDGSLVDLSVAASVVDGQTVAVLTFAGSDIGSLADGSYTLTVKADLIHDRWGRELDGDGDGSAGGNRVDGFFRLFGDADGDHNVDGTDRDLFRAAFGTSAADAGYLWYFDFDGDGVVDGRDNGEFNRYFGQF
jgi:hypothetical protein